MSFTPADDVRLDPAPLGPDGGPPRVPTAPLGEAWGIGPRVGALREVDGTPLREVTFAWAGDADRTALLHVNCLTDRRREDVTSSLCERVDGGHALTWLLPDHGAWGYRFVVRDELPADVGATRPGWVGVHRAGVPDPGNPDRLPDPFGGADSSVFRAPGWIGHPAWDDVRARAAATGGLVGEAGLADPARRWIDLDVPERTARLRVAEGADADLLVVFDGDWWARLGLDAALDARHRLTGAPSPHLLLLGSGDLRRRGEDLPHPHRVGAVTAAAIAAAAPHLPAPPSPRRTILAGQSYGGLAAASLLVQRPDLASRAIVQSGSFWFDPDADERPATREGFEPGRLLQGLTELARRGGDLPGRRAVVQVGRDEDAMVDGSRAFTAAARALGVEVAHREYRGGHDFAWWTDGLLAGLDLLEE